MSSANCKQTFDTYSAKLVNCSFYFFECRLTDGH